ncbi:MAG: phosphoribosyltransferase family protein [Bdellovibrionales bacterium]
MLFHDVMEAAAQLGRKVKDDGFFPDFLVGLARGGWIPSRLLSDVLGVKRLLSVGMAYEDAERTRLVAYDRPEPMPCGKKLLLVEDCLESGRSTRGAKAMLEAFGNEVRTAALYVTEASRFEPDYYAQKNVACAPEFPWEKECRRVDNRLTRSRI